MSALGDDVEHVVGAGNCAGCGGCALLSQRVRMGLDDDGFLRPKVNQLETKDAESSSTDRHESRMFRNLCPGVIVRAREIDGSKHHHIFGDYMGAWQGWASRDDFRSLGASGGVISALADWMLQTGRASTVIGSAGATEQRSQTRTIRMNNRGEVLDASGSRYAPSANLAEMGGSAGEVLVGKPCEATACYQYHSAIGTPSENFPIVFSFFCAGTPSQRATDELIQSLGVDIEDVHSVRYRGNGWPGDFVVTTVDGAQHRLSYEQSWGEHLGRNLQPRCKICVDGTGGHSDIAIGDFWTTDASGYPIFSEGEGNSVVIARTNRGLGLVLEAEEDGVLTLGDISLDQVAQTQPLQTERALTVTGRIVGKRLAHKPTPKYRGYRKTSLAIRHIYINARAAAGMFLRTTRIKA